MQIEKDRVVSIEYSIADTEGVILDHSDEGQTMDFIFGAGDMAPGLELGLQDKAPGDEIEVTVPPKDAFGEYNEKLIQRVDKDMFEDMGELQAGLRFRAETDNGMEIVTVSRVDGNTVDLDANHPLAGITLVFSAKVIEVREATEEELAHGHPHGPEGCKH